MLEDLLSPRLLHLRAQVETICNEIIAPAAHAVDAEGLWPGASLSALKQAGLTGLSVPAKFGGLGEGLLGLVTVTEALGAACSSTSMCFGMHCVASAVVAAKSSALSEEKYLRPIAEGRHLTTLALSESGTGAFFFLPETSLHRDGAELILRGEKQFVTNGAHADSYVVSTTASVAAAQGDFSCLVVDAEAAGLEWGDPWSGLGMRGNSSRAMRLNDVKVPDSQLLGQEGDQVWFVFEVVAPFFLMAMAGTYLGIAQAALDLAISHVTARRHTHSGSLLADADIVQHRVAELWTALQKSRLLVYHAARLGDAAQPDALNYLLASKADVARTAVQITNEAMSLCGGMAYRENSALARLLRDARASHVMSPTTELLTGWTGRGVLGLPLF
ncbi:acyl-CoA dehydrogenase family protein [Caballeronia sp. AZ7_KS35]|uniref:acyl-CoA dehydrogenase family protein n=1 Tax=Caballeronia sp. AZ7_KS35 TaxID=2921762 RepID=UPI002028927D|nr:acyl-CoA dehydrogenase family protein [Caballeronia sp. AZ7_KS35]